MRRPSVFLNQADAFEDLARFADDMVDLVVTDPPYESLEKHRAVGTTTRLKQSTASSNEWFPVIPNTRLPELMAELYRVLKPDRHCYVFCDAETLFHLKPAGEAAGFKFWKPLVWDKQHIGMGYHYRARYEFICFFEKGKRKLKDLSVPDVLKHPRNLKRDAYPAEKPWEVVNELVRQSTLPGEKVLDPFCGSCSTMVAALENLCTFHGSDLSTRSMDLGLAKMRAMETRVSIDPCVWYADGRCVQQLNGQWVVSPGT